MERSGDLFRGETVLRPADDEVDRGSGVFSRKIDADPGGFSALCRLFVNQGG
jgi:hypothetical protein